MSENHAYCSFCGKRNDEVEHLISGPAVFICEECIQLSCELINSGGLTPKSKAGTLIGYHLLMEHGEHHIKAKVVDELGDFGMIEYLTADENEQSCRRFFHKTHMSLFLFFQTVEEMELYVRQNSNSKESMQ